MDAEQNIQIWPRVPFDQLPQVQNVGSEPKATSIGEVLCLALLAILNRMGDSFDLAKWQKDPTKIVKGCCIYAGYSYLQQL